MRRKKGISVDAEADPKQVRKIGLIAKVSADLFSTKGYIETSMEDIAAAAGVTKGGIYHYFPSKVEILYYICSAYVEFDVDNLEQSLSGIDGIEEKLRCIIFRHVDHYANHAAAAKTLLNEAYNLPPRYRKEVKAREAQYVTIVSGILSQFLGARARKEVVTVAAFTLFGMMNWAYSWYDPKGAMKPTDLSQLIFEVFTNGVKNSTIVMGTSGTAAPPPCQEAAPADSAEKKGISR